MDASNTATLDRIRHFNRFYTRQLGLLDEGLIGSRFTLTEARVLYELACHTPTTAGALRRALGLDAGYLSRLLKRFDGEGMLARSDSPQDGRESLLHLTEAGRVAFSPLQQAAREQVAAMTRHLDATGRAALLEAMARVESLLTPSSAAAAPSWTLRDLQIGDIGWIAHRQALFYARELGLDIGFEALVASIAAAFAQAHDAQRERCWIAARGDEVLGSVFLVRDTDACAKLRLLFVEPAARGLGIGARLVDECVRFARTAGYREIKLWTNGRLMAARRIYQVAGFRLVSEEHDHLYGVDFSSQVWSLALDAVSPAPIAPR